MLWKDAGTYELSVLFDGFEVLVLRAAVSAGSSAISGPDVLILDELGYLPCDSRAADLLYNVLGRRHEHRSTIITTNLTFKQWATVFPGAACVVALVDRFAQHCHRVEIDADSWREAHGFEHDGAPPPTRGPRRPGKPR